MTEAVTPTAESGNVTSDSGSDPINLSDAVDLMMGSPEGQPQETEDQADPAQEPDANAEDQEEAEPDTDEQEGEEAENSEEEADADDEAEEETEDDSEPEAFFEVDGQKVTREEARDGYLRMQDYTRKTEAIAEERRTFEAEKQSAVEYLTEAIRSAEALLDVPSEAELEDLRETDPYAFLQKQGELDKKMKALNGAKKAASEQMKAAFQQQQQRAAQELQAGSYEPSWKDPAKFKADLEQVMSWAGSNGFSAEEINAISQPHHVITMDKARKYDALMAKKPEAVKKVADKPKVTKPGAKSSTRKKNAASEWKRFTKSPSVESAVEYMLKG